MQIEDSSRNYLYFDLNVDSTLIVVYPYKYMVVVKSQTSPRYIRVHGLNNGHIDYKQ